MRSGNARFATCAAASGDTDAYARKNTSAASAASKSFPAGTSRATAPSPTRLPVVWSLVCEEALCDANEKASFAEKEEEGLNLRSTSSYAPELGCAPSKPRSAPRAVARADRAVLSTELSTLSKRAGGTPV